MIGEIRMFAGNFAPKNWSYCNGSIIAIASNTALFSILGTTYGGNGTTTFALPDLRSRIPVGNGGSFSLGQMGGSESNTMTVNNMPAHVHLGVINVNSGSANQASPANTVPSTLTSRVSAPGYTLQIAAFGSTGGGPAMAANTVVLAPSGGTTPFGILNPYLGMNYVICMYGIFPSRG